jgi:hypothetical protein
MCLLKLAEGVVVNKTWSRAGLIFAAGLYLSIGGFIFGCVFTQTIIVNFIKESVQDIPLCVHGKASISKYFYYLNTQSQKYT